MNARKLSRNDATNPLLKLLATSSLVVCVGPGGVGKTTVSAALGLLAAQQGRRCLVLTIDPARRLADALGLRGLDDNLQAVPLPPELFSGTTGTPGTTSKTGTLHAAMLDTKASYDALIARIAPNPEAQQRILANPVYQSFSRTLARSHAYVAMERLHDVLHREQFDLVILDTPPTRNALDILDAPGRLVRFLDDNVLKTFLPKRRAQSGGRFWPRSGAMVMRMLSLLAGRTLAEHLLSFFEVFLEMREGFVQRAQEIQVQLRSPSTSFLLVTAPQPAHMDDASYLSQGLQERGVLVDAALFNRAYAAEVTTWPAAVTDLVDELDPEQIADEHPAQREAILETLQAMHHVRQSYLRLNTQFHNAIEDFVATLPPATQRMVLPIVRQRDLSQLPELLRLIHATQLWTS
jgi:anion-transporting  ArsA/GET3 family ATPase